MTVLKGKVAIVTGGGRGLGRSIAEAYRAAGAEVVITAAANETEIRAVAERTGAISMQADVASEDDAARVVDSAMARFGRIDILVNNAGRGMKFVNPRFMTDPEPFWECDPAVWRMIIDTNINGVFLMTRAVIPVMLRQGSGRIINLAINFETQKRKGFSPYGPSKAALEAMTAIWAEDLRGTGITVNAVAPGGATETGMIPDDFPEAMRAQLLPPDVITPAALYLASADAAAVTGQRLVATEFNQTRTAAVPPKH
ncbi:MAG: SDR family oxidoreductase [Betaproteobacteria bacterium]|nr:SDR family oxidoreductase [Betaproteobacteria bacterium]